MVVGLDWTCLVLDGLLDDFSILTRTSSQCRAILGLFKLLGITFAETGKKAVPFSQCFKMLGLLVSTDGIESGVMEVKHTNERREELRETIQDILSRGSFSGKEAERLRGRMVFFEGYTSGRVANGAVRALSRWCNYGTRVVRLDDEMKAILSFLRGRVLEAAAVKVERAC